ncbi:short transient receptor potential channel 5-like [Montipora capricornis]|uniref:short transient receptor potential channel 5-like n=1 Tax=Montipora capricornis TaxID=246305 RepID=UPI0035F1A26E
MNDPENPREDEGNARRSTRVFKMITRGTRRLQEGTEEAAISFRRFWRNHFPRDSARGIPIDITDAPDPDGITEAEEKIRNILNANINELSVDQIEDAITANNLCDCRNPITTAFEVSTKLKQLALIRDESEAFLNELAQQVEDFSVTLMQQIKTKEESSIDHESIDNYGALLDDITASAIRNSRKKFVSHPLTFRLMKRRWKYGLHPRLVLRKGLRFLFYIFVILDTALTPVLSPFIAYTFYKDQLSQKESKVEWKEKKKKLRDMYHDYLTTPFVIFIKDKICQFVFIILHIRMCVLDSSVEPRVEEYLILVFYIGFLMSELQQYLTSQSRVYLRNMWNYVDVITLSLHAVIFILRVVSVIRGGDPYHNRLLEITYYVYGINTLLLVLRFSSILEANKTVGPLQLALFRMCVDLFIILVQFGFVIVAFSVAITMVYTAEMSYVTLPPGERQSNTKRGKGFCQSGTYTCWYKASSHLIWSVFGLTDLEKMESQQQLSNTVVSVLYVIFLILSVIMLVNMLVALLTNTYDKVETNADVEWKFSRAVVAEEYRRCHPIIVPFNILSVPIAHWYIRRNGGDMREMRARQLRETYQRFYDKELFPEITTRYKEKHGGSFPMSVEGKVDFLQKNFQEILKKLNGILESHGNQERDQCIQEVYQ